MSIGLIILAAGGSTRFGSPKQLLRYQGQTLIRRAATIAIDSKCDRVVMVIGSRAEHIKHELEDLPLCVVENPNWQGGMSSSIQAGLSEVRRDEVDAVVIMLCDQPFVTTEVLDSLIETYNKTGMPIVASEYGATRGVPALFAAEFFDELTSLVADEGARRVIAKHPEMVATVAFADGFFDVDTPEDYIQLDRIYRIEQDRAE